MDNKLLAIFNKLLKYVVIIVFVLNFFLTKELNFSKMYNLFLFSAGLTFGIVWLFENYLWKDILSNFKKNDLLWIYFQDYEIPILKDEYDAVIKYEFNNKKGIKETIIKVNQTYSSINIFFVTDEIESSTVISEIIKKNDKFYLYYIYETVPKSKFAQQNPPQIGGCRITLDSIKDNNANEKLRGKYWTTSKTTGDMELTSN